jgi:hypothetical protein
MRVWILGADDPEMVAIRALLSEQGETFTDASIDGVRVHAGNAYAAPLPPSAIDCAMASGTVYLVECVALPMAGADSDAVRARCVRIDHHNPGDPGHGRPPAEFLPASSIGQVIAELARLGAYPLGAEREWSGPIRSVDLDNVVSVRTDSGALRSARFGAVPAGPHFRRVQNISGRGPAWWRLVVDGFAYQLPPSTEYVAAGDHCPAQAYRGECPGIDPNELMRWRAEKRAAHQGRSVEEVLSDVERASQALFASKVIDSPRHCGDSDDPACDTPAWAVRDVRGDPIPELPEAALRYGYCYIAGPITERDGRRKCVLGGHTTPEIVEAFLRGDIAPELIDRYGTPARGNAGGYLPEEER